MKKHNAAGIILTVLSVLLALAGVAAIIAATACTDALKNQTLQKSLFFGGLTALVFGAALLPVGISVVIRRRKAIRAERLREQASGGICAKRSPVFRQSIESKFTEMSKMDRAQFTVYAARLFANKGYDVRYTPVVDNYGIDLLVKRGDAVSAVCCMAAQKVLDKKDISFVATGRKYYAVSRAIVITNGYFNRAASDFARKEKITLIDRSVLKEDFLR